MNARPCLALMRPRLAAAADIDCCVRAGWVPLVLEYQQLQPQPAVLQQLVLKSLVQNVVLWVSPSAVHIAAKYVSLSESLLHVAVGASTASTLASYGFKRILYPVDGHDSEAVLRLPLWQQLKGRLLLIRGVGGRDLIINQLHQQGWQIEIADVYQRQPQPVNWSVLTQKAHEGSLKAVYMTTTAAVQAWFTQLPPDLYAVSKSLLYLVHHPRIATALTEYGVLTVQVSDLCRGLELLDSHSTF
jgi:uroporphyrinogen-III synthase